MSTASRLREWPRLGIAAVVIAVILVLIGVAIASASTSSGSSTQTKRTIAGLTATNAADVARLTADRAQISSLTTRLASADARERTDTAKLAGRTRAAQCWKHKATHPKTFKVAVCLAHR